MSNDFNVILDEYTSIPYENSGVCFYVGTIDFCYFENFNRKEKYIEIFYPGVVDKEKQTRHLNIKVLCDLTVNPDVGGIVKNCEIESHSNTHIYKCDFSSPFGCDGLCVFLILIVGYERHDPNSTVTLIIIIVVIACSFSCLVLFLFLFCGFVYSVSSQKKDRLSKESEGYKEQEEQGDKKPLLIKNNKNKQQRKIYNVVQFTKDNPSIQRMSGEPIIVEELSNEPGSELSKLEKLKRQKKLPNCVICKGNEKANVLYFPCEHLVQCKSCIVPDNCSVCSSLIEDFTEIVLKG